MNQSSTTKLRVMVAGIGGASLGTEIAKSLALTKRYEVFGCDISPTSYGLYDSNFEETVLVDREQYVSSVISACHKFEASWLLPGGEQPLLLLGSQAERIARAGICMVANHPDIIRTFSDKAESSKVLENLGIRVPRTRVVTGVADIVSVGIPCILKPATGSGGSVMVFFATDLDEAMIYADYISKAGGRAIAQEYIDDSEGEFTVGVLSLPDKTVVGSIALRRNLESKLSLISRRNGGVISSGYTQGFIGDFPEIRAVAESIASSIGSAGPINVQGRLKKGRFIPFEINPRFSASTYLRALAGFNEIDWFLQFLAFHAIPPSPVVREGWYLRSFTENYVSSDMIIRL